VHRELIISDLQKRLLMPGMSPPRAHMIPLASLLIQKVLSWMPENTILMHSGYALRQGVLDEMLDRKQQFFLAASLQFNCCLNQKNSKDKTHGKNFNHR
jgi:exopolyphosphatase/pppGpp-phosphohydrolase